MAQGTIQPQQMAGNQAPYAAGVQTAPPRKKSKGCLVAVLLSLLVLLLAGGAVGFLIYNGTIDIEPLLALVSPDQGKTKEDRETKAPGSREEAKEAVETRKRRETRGEEEIQGEEETAGRRGRGRRNSRAGGERNSYSQNDDEGGYDTYGQGEEENSGYRRRRGRQRASMDYGDSGDFYEGDPDPYEGDPDPYGGGYEEGGESAADFVIPDSDSRYLTESDLAGMSEVQCWVARNEIYARHGRRFENPKLQEYFDSMPWYYGTVDADAFNERVLSKIEVANLELIRKYERAHGYE